MMQAWSARLEVNPVIFIYGIPLYLPDSFTEGDDIKRKESDRVTHSYSSILSYSSVSRKSRMLVECM